FANDAVLMFAATQNDAHFTNSFTTTSPGPLNQSFVTNTTNNALTQGIGGAWAIKSGTGTTGNGTATISASKDWAAILISLKPAGCSCTPTIGGQGGAQTIECPNTPSFTAPTASDACGGNPTVQDLGATTTAGTCANNYTSTKSWRATNACGNTSGTVSQTITVRDTTAPTIGGQGSDATFECGTTMPAFTPPTASDTCSGATVNQVGSASTSANSCALVTTRSWRAVDACGNTSATVTQTSTVRDTSGPTIGSAGANNTVECPATATFTAPTASDNCNGATVQDLGDTTSGNSCALVHTKSWRAVDACGNTSATVT